VGRVLPVRVMALWRIKQEARLRQELTGTVFRSSRNGDNLQLIMPGNSLSPAILRNGFQQLLPQR